MIKSNELRREYHSARRQRVSTALDGVIALRCREASSAWEAI
jgi:hypothetical protein